MYYKACYENGIKFINDLTNNDGSFYTYDKLKAIYKVTINFLQYLGLVRSILAWKTRQFLYISPNNDCSFYTYDKLKATYKVTINFLQY